MSDRPLTPSELANRARENAKNLRLGARFFGAIHTIVIEAEPFARLYEELADEVDRLTKELTKVIEDERAQGEEVARLTEENKQITKDRDDWRNANNATAEDALRWLTQRDEERARADRLTEEKNDLRNALVRERAKDGGTWDQAAYDQLAEECNRERARADRLAEELEIERGDHVAIPSRHELAEMLKKERAGREQAEQARGSLRLELEAERHVHRRDSTYLFWGGNLRRHRD